MLMTPALRRIALAVQLQPYRQRTLYRAESHPYLPESVRDLHLHPQGHQWHRKLPDYERNSYERGSVSRKRWEEMQ